MLYCDKEKKGAAARKARGMSKDQVKSKFLVLVCALLIGVSMTGCTTNPHVAEGEVYDPLEDINRGTFAVNDALDQAIVEPVAKGYRAVTPKFVRNSVVNFLRNLRSPINVANQILQGDIEGAAADISRFAMNTTIGVGGLFDVAAETGLEYEREDFGQTLGVWGIDHGPYLVLPFFGPSSFRDATGLLVDAVADPVRIYLFNTDQEEWHYARIAATGLATREELIDVLDDLRENSLDYYAAMRSAYIQRRDAMVRDDDPDAFVGPVIPDYDDE